MGADILLWRDCPLQSELEPNGFIGKLKFKAYKRVIEEQVPEGDRDEVSIKVQVTGREVRELGYREICAGADEFAQGIPECDDCPISGGRKLGCYHYVTFPVDELFEKVVFDFFVSELSTPDSIGDQIYQDLVSQVPGAGTSWHTMRGDLESVARLPQALSYTWGGFFRKKRVDSAQLLQCLFITLDQMPLIAAYARFWSEFVDYAKANVPNIAESQTFAEVEPLALKYSLMTAVALEEGGSILIDA